MSKALEIVKMMKEDEEELSCGFDIVTADQDTIEMNFKERNGRAPNDKEWEQINKDAGIIEINAVAYLNKVLDGARDEGHGSDGDLVGSCWCRWDNEKGLETIFSHSDEASTPYELSSEEDSAFYKGVSKIALSSLGVELRFFDIKPEDMEKLITMMEK